MGTIIFLKMRKLRHKLVNVFAQKHIVNIGKHGNQPI